MGEYVKKKKEMVFQSVDSLQQVVNVINSNFPHQKLLKNLEK